MAGKKGKGAAKGKKVKFDLNSDIHQARFIKVYNVQCQIDKSVPCPWLISAMRAGVEEKLYVRKFIIEPEEPPPEGLPPNPPVRLDPVLAAVRKSHFVHIEELCVWGVKLAHRTVASVALMIEKGVFPIRKIELMDCAVSHLSIERLAACFKRINLTELNLDYNELGDEGCARLCSTIKDSKTLLQLSLRYCGITKASGACLGETAYSSMVRCFYLDGNLLENQGIVDFLRSIAVAAEDDHASRIKDAQQKATEGGAAAPKPKKGKKKSAEPPPVAGPFVEKLHLASNGIDIYNEGKEETLLPCIQVLSKLICHSTCLSEIDLADNVLGNLCSRQLLVALDRRAHAQLPAITMTIVGQGIKDEIYGAINKLASGATKKKGKKGKKK